MTVRELIDKLSKLDPKLIVVAPFTEIGDDRIRNALVEDRAKLDPIPPYGSEFEAVFDDRTKVMRVVVLS